MNLKKYVAGSIAVWIIFLVQGCASTVPLSPQDRQAVHTITVNPQVQMPKELSYSGPNSGTLFLATGAIISSIVEEKLGEGIAQTATNNHIDIRQIVLQELTQQINQTTALKVVPAAPADAELQVQIEKYGFSARYGFGDQGLYPMLEVEAKLVRDNQTIWEESASSYFLANAPLSRDQLFADPNNIRQSWTFAAQQVADKLVATLR